MIPCCRVRAGRVVISGPEGVDSPVDGSDGVGRASDCDANVAELDHELLGRKIRAKPRN